MKNGLYVTLILIMVILVAGCGEKLTEEQLAAKATDFQNKQQWEDLVQTYEKLVKTYPESPKAAERLYNSGMVYDNNMNEYEKAIQVWKTLLDKYPESHLVINTKFMIGYCYANHIKDMDKAREQYELFLKDYPDHELAPSVQWELDHLGQDISEIDLPLGDEEANSEVVTQ